MFLGCREGSVQTVRHLLMNYANRKVVDTMDKTPEDIAKQRHHHDNVELLTDWSLGYYSLKTVPPPPHPRGTKKSPLASMTSPATSPPAVEIHNGGEQHRPWHTLRDLIGLVFFKSTNVPGTLIVAVSVDIVLFQIIKKKPMSHVFLLFLVPLRRKNPTDEISVTHTSFIITKKNFVKHISCKTMNRPISIY